MYTLLILCYYSKMAQNTQNTNIDRETRRLYLRFTRPYLKQTVVMLLLRPMFLLSAYVGNIYLVSLALDRLAKNASHIQLWHDFGGLIIAAIILELIRMLTEQLSLNVVWKTQIKIENDIAAHCYENLTYRDATFHANRFTGSLVSQTNKFVGAYERIHDTLYWQVYAMLINLLATFIILFIKLPQFATVLLVIVSLYTWLAYRANKRASHLNAARSTYENANTGQLADSVTNILAVKSYAREPHEIKRYALGLEKIEASNDKLRSYAVKKDFKLSSLVSLVTALSLIMSIVAVAHGYATLGTIALATALTRDSLQRLREFNSNILRNIARAYGDARDMTGILLTKTEVKDASVPLDFRPGSGDIMLKDVTFWYPEKTANESLFEHLNLHIKPGEKVGLVGPSGGGKTTITKLLLRFMDIQSGAILVDEQDIAKVRQAQVRKSISYVPQEPLLFHRSLFENIRYGQPRATDEAVYAAARKAHAHDFINKLPQGYETLVGERGVKLSGGQRQRVAIARAMLKNAPILVLDEATSALDSEAESLIQDALWTLMKSKTAVVIAHRLSTIQKMDRILVLDDGKIVEEGTHKQLLKKKTGLYAKLWAHQSGGFLQD